MQSMAWNFYTPINETVQVLYGFDNFELVSWNVERSFRPKRCRFPTAVPPSGLFVLLATPSCVRKEDEGSNFPAATVHTNMIYDLSPSITPPSDAPCPVSVAPAAALGRAAGTPTPPARCP